MGEGMRRFWIRFYCDCELGLADKWPPNVQAWRTGYGVEDEPNSEIFCAIVDATSAEDAEQTVLDLYEEGGCDLDGTQEFALDWVPGDRFPGAKPYQEVHRG